MSIANTCKKLIVIALAGCMLITGLSFDYADAATDTNLSSTTTMKQVLVGETFEVTVNLKSNVSIISFSGGVSFNKNVVQFVDYVGNDSEDTSAIYLEKTSGANPYVELGKELGDNKKTFGMYKVTTSEATYKAGNLVTLRFKALALGDANIKLYEDTDGTDGKKVDDVSPGYTVTVVSKCSHSMTYHPAKDATYTSAGNSAYYYCSECNKYFSDNAGNTQIKENSWIIPKKTGKKGWVQDGDKWYYLDSNYNPVKGWKKLGRVWYYLDKSTGAMYTGLNTIDGSIYVFSSSGAMLTGWQKVNNNWYYLASSGAAVKGWKQISKVWYYFGSDAVMVTGVQTIGGAVYGFSSSGAMLKGWQKISGYWYYFTSSGAAQKNWLKSGGKWYWLNPDNMCRMVTENTVIDGELHKFNSSGVWLGKA